jgi:hypothetical protein
MRAVSSAAEDLLTFQEELWSSSSSSSSSTSSIRSHGSNNRCSRAPNVTQYHFKARLQGFTSRYSPISELCNLVQTLINLMVRIRTTRFSIKDSQCNHVLHMFPTINSKVVSEQHRQVDLSNGGPLHSLCERS